MDDEIPYRSPIDTTPAQQVSSTDEQEYSTLQIARETLRESIDNLKSFNAFDLQETEMKVKQQIKAHQLAYDILTPIYNMIDDAMILINEKYKR